jgi:hypothetical protein
VKSCATRAVVAAGGCGEAAQRQAAETARMAQGEAAKETQQHHVEVEPPATDHLPEGRTPEHFTELLARERRVVPKSPSGRRLPITDTPWRRHTEG